MNDSVDAVISSAHEFARAFSELEIGRRARCEPLSISESNSDPTDTRGEMDDLVTHRLNNAVGNLLSESDRVIAAMALAGMPRVEICKVLEILGDKTNDSALSTRILDIFKNLLVLIYKAG